MFATKIMRPIARSCCNILAEKYAAVSSRLEIITIQRRGQLTSNSKPKAAKDFSALKNNMIRAASMRVVYTDKVTGLNVHKVLSRQEALDLARDYKLDLVLGNW
jgi:hypothetical protein